MNSSFDTTALAECYSRVSAHEAPIVVHDKSFFEAGFLVKFSDLTEEAQRRFRRYFAMDVDDDMEVAADIQHFIHNGIIK